MLRKKFIAFYLYIRKEERSQFNYVSLQLNKKEKRKFKGSRRIMITKASNGIKKYIKQ